MGTMVGLMYVMGICGLYYLVLGLWQDTCTLQVSLGAFSGGVGYVNLSGHEGMMHDCVCGGWQRTPLSQDKV